MQCQVMKLRLKILSMFIAKKKYTSTLKTIKPFYNEALYINALAESIKALFEKLIMIKFYSVIMAFLNGILKKAM